MKRLIVVVIILAILTSTGVLAASNTKVNVVLNPKLKFIVNNESWTPKDSYGNKVLPITHNDTTFLPLRSVAETVGAEVGWDSVKQTITIGDTYDTVLKFPADLYPETAAHISSAMLNGHSQVCTISRAGADARRDASLKSIPIVENYDRDEWPMAMCEEGGNQASVAYIDPADNRGAGAWVGNQLENYPDGTKVKFVVSYRERDAAAKRDGADSSLPSGKPLYNSCAEAKAAGAAPLYKNDPGYNTKLDRDGDGVACES